MNKLLKMLILLGLMVGVVGLPTVQAQDPDSDQDTLFQVSTLAALSDGVFQGVMNFEELSAYGDFGLGTFEGVDGEMVAFDGQFYQVLVDGTVQEVDPQITTPFAAVTFFEADATYTFEESLTCADFYAQLATMFPSPNLLYAVRIDGVFASLKTRSVAPQTEPYPPLADVVAAQAEFEFTNTEATLAGYWLPTYLTGINAVGFHLHGLIGDHSAGGHVLDCQIQNVTVQVDDMAQFEMLLPENDAFLATDLTQ